jgi:dolichyl-phosphate-mannose--protein O-mannosyl transferase
MSTTLNTDARSIQPSESPSSSSPDSTADQIFLVVLFVATVVANLILVTRSWHSGFLIGHEFRQSQTAIISYYIDQQNNFSLHYDTPILGKPWEAPLELPLYQWGVVLLSRLTHWPHYESARAVGVTALYLTLPALYLLLGRAGLPPRRRLIAFALLLATPVYIFYSRAFLMDVTAMMFAAWFLAGFVEAMNTRKLGCWSARWPEARRA